MRPTPKETSWGAWPTGLQKAGIKMVGVEGRHTTETIEVRPYGRVCGPKDTADILPDQPVYGAGTSSIFAVQSAEDESSFSVVDNTRTSNKTRGFGRGGGTVFRGRGRGAQTQRGGRGQYQRVGGRGGQQGNYYDNRGGRGGRGGRRFGWKDYDKPQRNREFSVSIKPDWNMLEEIDFNRLQKLHMSDAGTGEDLESYGFLYYYDRSYDKQPVKKIERPLNVVDRLAYNVTTSSDPVIQELAERDAATVYATDAILSALMCAPRSVYSWDIVLTRTGNKLFLDKRDGSAVDMVSVNENAVDAPLEASEGNKDAINLPSNLADEAATINHLFAWQTVAESESARHECARPNPFYNPDSAEERETPLASKAYKYRRYDLTGGAAVGEGATPITLVVRTELDAVVKNNISGEDQFLTIHALNEFDNKASGGSSTDWRTKLLSQPGAVVATEMKNNSCKLARWTTQSILAKADVIKLGYAHPLPSSSRCSLCRALLILLPVASSPVPTPRTPTATSSWAPSATTRASSPSR